LIECQKCAKLSSRQRVSTLKNQKCVDLLNTFLVTKWFLVCSFIVLMSSLLSYNIEDRKNKEKPLNEWVCLNFWLVLYAIVITVMFFLTSNINIYCPVFED
jgi:hypothetical protein